MTMQMKKHNFRVFLKSRIHVNSMFTLAHMGARPMVSQRLDGQWIGTLSFDANDYTSVREIEKMLIGDELIESFEYIDE